LRQTRAKLEQSLIRRFGIQFNYGHREIILKAAGLQENSLLLGIVQHGVGPTFTLYSDWPTPRLNSLRRTPLWVYSKENENELRNLGVRDVKAIGSPWLYSINQNTHSLSSLLPNSSKGEYCLVFPSHTNFAYLEITSEEGIVSRIKSWKKVAKNDKMVICLYWVEFLDQRWHNAAELEGVKLTCVGIGATDPLWSKSERRLDFYKNLRSLLINSSYCIFEGFTSAIFYASSLEIPFGIFATSFEDRKIADSSQFSQERTWLLANAGSHFNEITTEKIFTEKSLFLLGIDQLQNPEELKSILEWRVLKTLNV
jgi:hypothetical protein